jgi:predicted MFS family arabinose efflux permease
VGLVGFIIAIATMNTAARYVSLFLMVMNFAGIVCLYAWISNSFPRPPAKRAVVLALTNAISQLGSFAGSYIWPKEQFGPTYRYSYAICIASLGASLVMLVVFRMSLMRLNKKLDEDEEERDPTKTEKGFRYII